MIIKTETGVRHIAETGLYSGEIHESGESISPVKRGRGRPRKDTGPSGATYNTIPLMKVFSKYL